METGKTLTTNELVSTLWNMYPNTVVQTVRTLDSGHQIETEIDTRDHDKIRVKTVLLSLLMTYNELKDSYTKSTWTITNIEKP